MNTKNLPNHWSESRKFAHAKNIEACRVWTKRDQIIDEGRFWDNMAPFEGWNSDPAEVKAQVDKLGDAAEQIEREGGYYCDTCHRVYDDIDCPHCAESDRRANRL